MRAPLSWRWVRVGAVLGFIVTCAGAGGNATAAVPRPRSVAGLGPAPKAIVLFTHLRRCGGSFLEDTLLKPHVVANRLGKPLLCKEGELARHARLGARSRAKFAAALERAPLVWRHCPFGSHALLGRDRPYVYVTVVRRPLARMASWFAYCDTYSKDKCHTAPYAPRGGGSKMLQFYDARRRKYQAVPPAKIEAARRGEAKTLSTFHPNWLEFALDDNYATRMLCGGDAHDHAVPLPVAARDCAIANLRTQYAFVGALERQSESLCVLSSLLGATAAATSGDARKGPTTHTSAANHPADFVEAFSRYVAHDDVVYAEATSLLDAHLAVFPRCRKRA